MQARLADMRGPVLADGVATSRAQVNALVRPGFVTAAGAARLGDVPRYLQAMELRLDKLHADPDRDARWSAEVRVVAASTGELAAAARGASSRRRSCGRSAG